MKKVFVTTLFFMCVGIVAVAQDESSSKQKNQVAVKEKQTIKSREKAQKGSEDQIKQKEIEKSKKVRKTETDKNAISDKDKAEKIDTGLMAQPEVSSANAVEATDEKKSMEKVSSMNEEKALETEKKAREAKKKGKEAEKKAGSHPPISKLSTRGFHSLALGLVLIHKVNLRV